ncbi:MAG: outer membrane beta-barrel protein [Bacteroidia bacterium]
MKNRILLSAFLIGVTFVNAQQINNKESFAGLRIGFNIANERSYGSTEKTENVYSVSGSQFAIFHERKVGNLFSFINEIHYSQQGVLFSTSKEKMQYDFSNWNVPFLCKWTFGGSNVKVHILTGLYASYIYSAKFTLDYKGVKDELVLSGSDWETFKINRLGYGATLGGGISYYLPNSSLVVFDLRFKHDLDFVSTQDKAFSRVWGFSIGYAYPISKMKK